MTNAEIDALLRPHLEAAGLIIIDLQVKAYDDQLMAEVPIADAYVFLPPEGAESINAKMHAAARSLSLQLGYAVRAGYYSAAIGYDDVPAGQAMLEFDDFPFALDPIQTARP